MAQLTEEQRAWWDQFDFSIPSENPSAEEWRQFVSQMQYVFKLDGYDEPSEEALRDEVKRRRKGGGDAGGEGDGGLPEGGYIDLPFESGSADPQHIQYADLGPDKKYTPES